MLRICNACGQRKSVDLFYVNRNRSDGRCTICKSCSNIKHAEWCRSNQKRASELKKASEAKKPEQYAQMKRIGHWRRKYGLSAADVSERISNQKGQCPICFHPLKKFFIDHDHKTGKIRGILCPGCNTAIGLLHESKECFLRAFSYLGFSL